MDVISALSAIPAVGPLLPYLLLAGVIAAALSTALPPPSGSGTFLGQLYSTIYHLVNWLGLNFGHAKNAAAPDAGKPPSGTLSALIALFALGLVLTACSAGQKQTALDVANAGAPIAAQVVVDNASPAQLANLDAACDASGVLVAVADTTLKGGAAATVPKIAAPGASFCKIVKAGKVPKNADSNSINWLAVLSTTISTVKALAG